MTHNQFLVMIILLSSCFFIVSLILDQGRWVMNMIFRGGLGIMIIGLINEILTGFGLIIPVGINLWNFLVITLLGMPGLFAIYGIGLWQIFG